MLEQQKADCDGIGNVKKLKNSNLRLLSQNIKYLVSYLLIKGNESITGYKKPIELGICKLTILREEKEQMTNEIRKLKEENSELIKENQLLQEELDKLRE